MTSPLDPTQRATLDAVLDSLIPPSRDPARPGAGELSLGEPIAAALGDALAGFLDALDTGAGSGARFGELDASAREQLLRETADAGVLRGLVFHTYVHYYEHPRVIESLGLDARPPFPRGYVLEAGDPELLAPVRRRAPFYREA